MLFKDEQALKADCAIVVTLLGIVTLVNDVNLQKDPSLINVMLFGKVNFCTDIQLINALLPM